MHSQQADNNNCIKRPVKRKKMSLVSNGFYHWLLATLSCVLYLHQELANIFSQGKIVNMFGLANHMVSVTIIQLYSVKTALDNAQMY